MCSSAKTCGGNQQSGNLGSHCHPLCVDTAGGSHTSARPLNIFVLCPSKGFLCSWMAWPLGDTMRLPGFMWLFLKIWIRTLILKYLEVSEISSSITNLWLPSFTGWTFHTELFCFHPSCMQLLDSLPKKQKLVSEINVLNYWCIHLLLLTEMNLQKHFLCDGPKICSVMRLLTGF